MLVERRQWRLRQRPFQILDQPGAPPCQSRPARRRDRHRLRLKLIADAGFVGLPNAGKSTFLAQSPRRGQDRRLSVHDAASWARRRGDRRREFVLADIPGLIEGAHEGAGLGTVSRPRRALPGAAAPRRRDGRAARRGLQDVRAELDAYGAGWPRSPRSSRSTRPTRSRRGRASSRRAPQTGRQADPAHPLRRDR